MTRQLTIRVTLTPGVCRWCRCTYNKPCANGCSWADLRETLCSECLPLDEAIRTARGRVQLAECVQERTFLIGRQTPTKTRTRR